MNVIRFPKSRPLTPIDLGVAHGDESLDDRVQRLLPMAYETIDRFPADAIAEMLCYAAARLERTGFSMFGKDLAP